MICAFKDEHEDEFGVEPVCRSLREAGAQIAPNTYDARENRLLSAKAQRDAVLTKEFAEVHAANYGAFGARKMHIVLNCEPDTHGGGHVARCTIERLVRELGLHGIRRAKAPRTTRSVLRDQCPDDLLNRHLSALSPNELWVADITYVHTFSGWVYVAFVIDVVNREIVGLEDSSSLHSDLALDALNMGIYLRRRADENLTGSVHHSDRGVQYRSILYG